MTDDDLPAPGRIGEAPRDVDPPPEPIAELAEACRQYVLTALGVELDFTPETLPVLDHYLTTARAGLAERPELEQLLGRSAGAYFGEVLRRSVPSFWRIPSGDIHDWQICGQNVYLAINPFGVAWDALLGGSEHAGPCSDLQLDAAERGAVERRLAELPEVPEQEYWLLSTRLEVLQIAAEQVRLEMQHAGTESVTFEDADYEISMRPIGQA